MPTYLAKIKLGPKTPGDYGYLYWADNGIWMHNIDRGWQESQRIPCQERDAVEVIEICWWRDEWELEILMEGAENVQNR